MKINKTKFDLNSIIHSNLIGPLMTKNDIQKNFGLILLKYILNEDLKSIPNIGFGWIDIRDVCKIVNKIISKPDSHGRFLCCNQSLTLPELSLTLNFESTKKSSILVKKKKKKFFLIFSASLCL